MAEAYSNTGWQRLRTSNRAFESHLSVWGQTIRKAKGQLNTREDLHATIIRGTVDRVRPKMMTVAAAMMGLMLIMWSLGTGFDVMKRVAAPMVGGLATSFLMELLVYPAIYLIWKRRELAH
jgi:copper/silver efflux system protein